MPGPGRGTKLSPRKAEMAKATASKRDSACTWAACNRPSESVNDTLQRAIGMLRIIPKIIHLTKGNELDKMYP